MSENAAERLDGSLASLRRSLATIQDLDWFSTFARPLDELISEAVSRGPLPEITLDPLHYESHIASAVHLMERCLAYRREAREVDIAALKAADDYARFLRTAALDQELQSLTIRLPQLEAEKSGLDVTQKRFAAATDPLAVGFAQQTTARGSVVEIEVGAAVKALKLIDDRWRIERQHAQALAGRHQESGNSHNFAQRRDRLIGFLAEDLQEIQQKLRAAMHGLRLVYGNETEFEVPAADTEGVLDLYVALARRLGRFLESQINAERSIEVVLSVSDLVGGRRAFLRQWKGGEWKFDVAGHPQIPQNKTIKLHAVGISVACNLSSVSESSGYTHFNLPDLYARVRFGVAAVALPSKSVLSGVVNLSPIGAFGSATPVAYSSQGCLNADPRGEWSVKLSINLTEKQLYDVMLHLRLAFGPVAKPESL